MSDMESNYSASVAKPGILAILRKYAGALLVTTLLGLAAALAYTHFATPKYRVTLTLVPSEDNAAAVSTLGSGSGLSSLASLAGVNLPTGTNALSFELFPDALVSRETAEVLAADPNLMRTAFARFWDRDERRWREPEGVGYAATRAIRAGLGYNVQPFSAPDGLDFQEFLQKHMRVVKDRKRPVIELSIDHADREFARTLLLQATRISDNRLKNAILERSSKNIAYLSDRLNQTQNIEYRNFLYVTMSQEEKRVMSTSNGLPYVAEPFGVPVVSMEPVVPDVPVAIGLGLVVGLGIGLFLVGILRRDVVGPALAGLLKDA